MQVRDWFTPCCKEREKNGGTCSKLEHGSYSESHADMEERPLAALTLRGGESRFNTMRCYCLFTHQPFR
jgi:hypothetical protein